MTIKIILSTCLATICVLKHTHAQTSPQDLIQSYHLRKKMEERSPMKNYPVRQIGPSSQGGRIIDIEVNESNTNEFYVAYGSGGIFKTVTNGNTFTPIFDNQDALGIGDLAISQKNPQTLYVGTGEKNSSRSSYAGSGVYKTTDGGRTWKHLGLEGTHHIGRVIIHPNNEDVVWVAALGPLYSFSKNRGIYKTTDGGDTWQLVLFVSDSCGIIDLAINPKDPNQLLATSWERIRKAGHFKGNGLGSTIYRSQNGGETWTRSTHGFPQGDFVGRIGLSICRENPNTVYAVLDNQQKLTTQKPDDSSKNQLQLSDFKTLSTKQIMALDNNKLNRFLQDNDFPKIYSAKQIKEDLKKDLYTASDIASYFTGDANANLFETKIQGVEVYRSDDGGIHWKKTHQDILDGVYYTYGYYFGELLVDPIDSDQVYLYGVPLLQSKNGGKTWTSMDSLNRVHGDHHAMWINPKNTRHILLGNDGGLYQSYDRGIHWRHINNMPVGQFYTVSVDMNNPYQVYGGLQDNGVMKGSSISKAVHQENWKKLYGGDGMFVFSNPVNNKEIYAGYQFGHYVRINYNKKDTTLITPFHKIGEPPLRWNWRTPLLISTHHPDIIYMGAQKVLRSMNKGDTWEPISPDLTHDHKQGNVPFSTITSLVESPLQFGLLCAGTDDGNVWISTGITGQWEQINSGLPKNKWVSSIHMSPHDKNTLFISLNGYREDDFTTYIFKSVDQGKTWKSIQSNLPHAAANVIIQDPINPHVLYCGLDNGTYTSWDGGSSWALFNSFLHVPSYDMVIHPIKNELIVATHGRSIMIADCKPLQKLKNKGQIHAQLMDVPDMKWQKSWGKKKYAWTKPYTPSQPILYYIGTPTERVTIHILNDKNDTINSLSGVGEIGFHSLSWDGTVVRSTKKQLSNKEKTYAKPGTYKIILDADNYQDETTFEIN